MFYKMTTKSFAKWLLIAFCLVNVTMWISFSTMTTQFADTKTSDPNSKNFHNLKKFSNNIKISILLLVILFQMFGFYGALQEDETFVTIYSVLTILLAVFELFYSFWTKFQIIHWSGSLWYVFNSLVAMQFLGILKQQMYLERFEKVNLLKSYDVYPSYELNKL